MRSGTGWGTLGEVRDGEGDPRGGPRRVGGPSGRYGMARETLGKVRDGSEDPWGGLGQVVRCGTGRQTLG